LRSGKGPAYERWVKVYNLKQMAAALQFIQEHQISEYSQLTTEAEAASARFHALTEQLRQTEADLAYTSELMGAVVQYAKTRPVFDEYKAAKYSKKFLAQHEAELADYRAAKAALNDLLDGAKDGPTERKAPQAGGGEKGPVCQVSGRPTGNAAGRGGQDQH